MEEVEHYSMIIEWDPDDKIYVVTVPELDGCMTHGRTYEEAVRQGQDAIESWIMVVLEDNDPIPPPQKCAA
jgi:predicted RNase H-like HicB family nuclease